MGRLRWLPRDGWSGVALAIHLVIAFLLVYPLARLFTASFIGEGGGISLENYVQFFRYRYYRGSVWNSFQVSSLVTLGALVVGVPLAFLVTRFDIPGKAIVRTLAVLPLLSPPFIGAYSWILLMGRSGYLMTLLQAWGIHLPTIYGMHGIVLSLTLNLYPFVFLIVSGALMAVDRGLEEAGQSLGSSPLRTFFTVTLPVTLPSVLAGALLVFLSAFAEFGSPMIIGEGYTVLPTLIYSLFINELGGNPTMASTASSVLVLCCTAVLLLQRWYSRRKVIQMSSLARPEVQRLRPVARTLVTGAVYLVVAVSLLPSLVILIISFFKSRGPVLYPEFSLDNYANIFFSVPRAILNSFFLSGLSSALDVLVGTLLGYILIRRPSPVTTVLDSVVMLPYAIPGTVIGVAYIVAFNRPPLLLTGTFLILVLAYFVRRLPYSVRASAAILQQIDPNVEEASVSLGVPPLRSFFKITARLMAPGIIAGGILTWVQTITEISSTIFLFFGAWATMTVIIYRQVISSNFGSAAAASSLLLLVVFLPLLVWNLWAEEKAMVLT